MRGRLGISTVLAIVACSISLLAPGTAGAGHNSKDCGIVSHGSTDYRVRAMKLKCKVARKGSTKYLRSGQPRTGFDCTETEGDSFYCQNPPKAYWGIRL